MKIKNLIYLFFLLWLITLSAYIYIKPYNLLIKQITGVSFAQLVFQRADLQAVDGRVNFLFLGKAGGDFAAPDLTDSIMVVSFDKKENKVYTISIARDIWSDKLQDKINTAYLHGKVKGVGLSLIQSEVEAIVGFPLSYVMVIDFDRFRSLVDYLGGIDIGVERAFEDFKYPVAGRANDLCDGDLELKCRYEHITFKRGLTHMDGQTALQFARSRNSTDREEGTDFARGRRQQKVMTAIYQKIIRRVKKFNRQELEEMYFLIDSLVERNISNKEAVFLLRETILHPKIRLEEIHIPQDYFIVPPYVSYRGQYVLIPKTGDFSRLHDYFKQTMTSKDK